MSILDEVANMTPEEFEKLSDTKVLEWLEALEEEVGQFGVLAGPSDNLRKSLRSLCKKGLL